MWLKFLIAALILAFCIALGYLAAGKYRSRRQFYSQFAAFNERYLSELSYARKPLADFLTSYAYAGDFGKSVASFERDRRLDFGYSYLTKAEKTECEDYFSMLGKGDVVSQSGYFSARKTPLAEKKTACEQEAKSRGELYIKLGLLAGLAIVILIV